MGQSCRLIWMRFRWSRCSPFAEQSALVVPGDAELTITLGEKAGTEAKVSFDSQLEFGVQQESPWL